MIKIINNILIVLSAIISDNGGSSWKFQQEQAVSATYYNREISKAVFNSLQHTRILEIYGPKRAGKSFMLKNQNEFKNPLLFKYIDLENKENDFDGLNDTNTLDLLKSYSKTCVIMDEIKKKPILLDFIEAVTNLLEHRGQFIFTSSLNIVLLTEKAPHLPEKCNRRLLMLPLSIYEYKRYHENVDITNLMIKGFYPELHASNEDPNKFYDAYLWQNVYLNLIKANQGDNMNLMEKVLSELAQQSGDVLNISKITQNFQKDQIVQVQYLINILQIRFIIFTLRSFNLNNTIEEGKPKNVQKLYFYDSGILCFVLGIKNSRMIENYVRKEKIFENLVVVEIIKTLNNYGCSINLIINFCTAKNELEPGEIDIIVLRSKNYVVSLVEIKYGSDTNSAFHKSLNNFYAMFKSYFRTVNRFVIYIGVEQQKDAIQYVPVQKTRNLILNLLEIHS